MQPDTLTANQTETNVADLTAEDRLAQISAAIAAKQAESKQATEEPKAKLAPFTCSMDPAERALCDSCQ